MASNRVTETVANRDGSDEIVCMRVMKIVKGKWTMLADQDASSSKVYIPRLNHLGVDHDVQYGSQL